MKHIVIANIGLMGLFLACGNNDGFALAGVPIISVSEQEIGPTHVIIDWWENSEKSGERSFPGFDLRSL